MSVLTVIFPLPCLRTVSEGHISNNFRLLRSKMRRLPPVHQATLKAIVEHLAKVASHSEKNKMDAKNLAIVFGTVIFGEDEIPKAGDLLSVQAWKVRFHSYFEQVDIEPYSGDAGYPHGRSHYPRTCPVPVQQLLASITTSTCWRARTCANIRVITY